MNDVEGTELPDLGAARSIAIGRLRYLVASELRDGNLDLTSAIHISDLDAAPLMVVPLAEAVIIEDGLANSRDVSLRT